MEINLVTLIKTLTFSLVIFTSNLAFAVNGWSQPHMVKLIDSLTSENESYITLDGFSDPACNNNRIHLTSSNSEHYNEMMSLVLSAFHANSKINIYLSSSCKGVRVMLSK